MSESITKSLSLVVAAEFVEMGGGKGHPMEPVVNFLINILERSSCEDAIEKLCSKAVEKAADNFDFDDHCESAVENFDFEKSLDKVLEDYDFKDAISTALSEYDYEEVIEKMLEDIDPDTFFSIAAAESAKKKVDQMIEGQRAEFEASQKRIAEAYDTIATALREEAVQARAITGRGFFGRLWWLVTGR